MLMDNVRQPQTNAKYPKIYKQSLERLWTGLLRMLRKQCHAFMDANHAIWVEIEAIKQAQRRIGRI